jgi:hypothetical protein
MKLTIVLLAYLVFFHQLSIAQPGFNIVHDLGLDQNHLKEMIVKNDTIIGYGLAQIPDSSGWRQGLLLVKFDSSGNVLHDKFLLDTLGDHYGIGEIWGEIINTSDGGFAMTAAAFFRKSAFLIKLSNDFEVEFIKEYPKTNNLSNYNYKILEITGGYLLFGAIQRPNYKDNAFAQRVDNTGETIWFKYFGSENLNAAYNGGAKFNDSLYILVGGREILSGGSLSFIDIINGEGEIIKSWFSSPSPDIGILRNIMVLPDGNLLTDGDYLADTTPFGTDLYNSALSRMDTNFQVLSTHYYGTPVPLTGGIRFWDFEYTPDGYFVGAGKGVLPYEQGENAGWLMKFDENGDSLWSQYVIAPFEDPISDWHYLGGVGVLSSGSIVAGGEARNGQQQYIWLVKLTKDGCLDTLWCNPVSVIVEEKEEKEVLRVYPNPANQTMTVESESTLEEGVLRLIDLQGQTVITQALPFGSNRLSLEVGDVPAGIYFLEIIHSGGKILRQKVLIAR